MRAPSTQVPTQMQNSSRPWLELTMQTIENNISLEASVLMQNPILHPINLKKSKATAHDKDTVGENPKSLTDLRNEEVRIREKLREICKLQKLVKPTSRFRNQKQQEKVKTNSQLRMLTKKYRLFKQQLIEKTRLIMEQEQTYKENAKKLKQQRIKTQCEQRRKKIEQTLFNMQERRIRRQEELKQQKIKLRQLKKQKLYEKMRENFNKSMNEMNEKKIERYQKMKNSSSVDMSALSLHEKRYQQEKDEKEEKRTQRLAESRILPEINSYKSKFFDMVMEDDREKQERLFEIAERARMVKKMHKQYQQRIQQFAPPLKENLKSSMSKENKKPPLDRSQINKKGNEFYKQGLKRVIPAKKRAEHQKQKQISLQLMAKKPYRNYLPEISKKLLQSPSKQSNGYTAELERLRNKILADDKMKKEDKIEEIRNLIQKMEHSHTPNKSNQDEIVRRLHTKMQLLGLLQ